MVGTAAVVAVTWASAPGSFVVKWPSLVTPAPLSAYYRLRVAPAPLSAYYRLSCVSPSAGRWCGRTGLSGREPQAMRPWALPDVVGFIGPLFDCMAAESQLTYPMGSPSAPLPYPWVHRLRGSLQLAAFVSSMSASPCRSRHPFPRCQPRGASMVASPGGASLTIPARNTNLEPSYPLGFSPSSSYTLRFRC